MRKNILVIGIIASLIATPAIAEGTASKKETIGVGVGAVIGAVAGGPVGFIVGAAFGGKLGDEFHKKDAEVTSLSQTLVGSKAKITELESSVDALNGDIDALGGDLQRMRERSYFRVLLMELIAQFPAECGDFTTRVANAHAGRYRNGLVIPDRRARAGHIDGLEAASTRGEPVLDAGCVRQA